jgi:cell division initiation protein
MKITPLEIRQRTFEKNFRGYDKDEVNAFLLTLSQEWERMLDEVRDLKLRLETAEKEVARMREVETSLFKTLKTAEDTGSSLIEQSKQQATLLVREAQLQAEALLHEAREEARKITDAAELRSRQLLAEMEVRLKSLAENYRKLQHTRENLLAELKHLAEDTLERTERLRAAQPEFDVDSHLNKITLAEQPEKLSKPEAAAPQPITPPAAPAERPPQPVLTSFFDEIG